MNEYLKGLHSTYESLNGSFALQHFERSNTIKICNVIMFDFYLGLPHVYIYCTAGNIGGELNLAAWRLEKRPSNLNPSNLSAIYACACAHIICMELPPNLNPPIFLFRPLGTKPPNLKIANISGYTVHDVSAGHLNLLKQIYINYVCSAKTARPVS